MKKFQYQIVKYLHDSVTSEFVNIGVIVYQPETRFLASKFINKFGRISHFFTDINGQHIISTLRQFEKEIKVSSERLNELFSSGSSLVNITNAILTPDNSPLVCSELFYGIDINPQSALDDLYERMIERYQSEPDKIHHDDKYVWKKIYKAHFDKYGITSNLKPHTIKTSHDSIEFDKAWKNGVWNCYQTLSFDLKREDSIKSKVYKWSGILSELENSDEAIHLYFLTSTPKNKAITNFILDTLGKRKGPAIEVTIVNEKQADKFAQTVKKQIEIHDSAKTS